MKKIFLLGALLFAITALTNAQESRTTLVERVELDIKDEAVSNFEVISLAEKGLINVYSQRESKGRKWTFKKMDINLTEVAKKEIVIGKKYRFVSSYVTKTHFHAMFRVKSKAFKIVSLELESMKIQDVDSELPKAFFMEKMVVIGENAVIDTKTRKEAFLTVINWSTGKSKIIPINVAGANAKRIFFQNFQVLSDESELFAFVTAKADKKTDTYVIRVDRKGNKKKIFCLTEKYENVISDISVSKMEDEEFIYTGTYSEKNATYSNGLFFAKSIGLSLKFIESYNFLSLNKFLEYLPARKQAKVERKQKRKEKRGKEMNINYLIASHDIIKKGDKYIMLGEAYYPTYRTETRTDANGNVTYRTVFDGYQYTHAVVAGFDKDGGLIWDNSFKLFPSYKPYFVKRFISVSEANEKEVQLVFSAGRSIYSKTIDNFNGKTIDEKESEIISTGDEDDKLTWSASAETDYWYERNFITYGYQKIKNKSGDKKRKRKVYYINKIQY